VEEILERQAGFRKKENGFTLVRPVPALVPNVEVRQMIRFGTTHFGALMREINSIPLRLTRM
jgi:hypothetical protein